MTTESPEYAVELGYHVTLIRDATSAASADTMSSAHNINGPTYAHAVITTADLVAALSTPAVPMLEGAA